MSLIEIILAVLIPILLLLKRTMLRYYLDDKEYKITSYKKLKLLVIRLKESVNFQRLIFLENENIALYLIKYQQDEHWGIKLICSQKYFTTEAVNRLKTGNTKIKFENSTYILDFQNRLEEILKITYLIVKENKFVAIDEHYLRYTFKQKT